jgi:TPR repeat protein
MNIKQLLIATILLLSSAAYGQPDFDATKLLAEQGNAIAQSNLGIMYANGDGVPENDTEAVKWGGGSWSKNLTI